MKKLVSVLLAIMIMFTFCACNDKKADDSKSTTKQVAATEKTTKSYKKSMKKLSELKKAPRIVIFQNAVKENFTNDDTAPISEKKTVNGKTVDAFAVKNASDVLLKQPTANITVIDQNDKKTTITAADFLKSYIATAEDGSGIMITPKTTIKNFVGAITADGEAVIFCKKSENLKCGELLKKLGLKEDAKQYRFVATDEFYVPCDAKQVVTAELRGTVSGLVNGSLPVKMAGGKVNDVLYVEIVE